jgi:hypothetical protein
MNTTFNENDLKFLRSVGISTEPDASVNIEHPDGTVKLLKELGIPVTRENYLRLAFAGNPPQELDGELEAELPTAFWECPSGGESDEPSYTTRSGIPICSKCGKSTRNMNQLVCAPCRKRTRLLLTDADKKWLREMGIAR